MAANDTSSALLVQSGDTATFQHGPSVEGRPGTSSGESGVPARLAEATAEAWMGTDGHLWTDTEFGPLPLQLVNSFKAVLSEYNSWFAAGWQFTGGHHQSFGDKILDVFDYMVDIGAIDDGP